MLAHQGAMRDEGAIELQIGLAASAVLAHQGELVLDLHLSVWVRLHKG